MFPTKKKPDPRRSFTFIKENSFKNIILELIRAT